MRFFLILMVIISSGCLCAESNLLENPSFEIQQETGGVPENWKIIKNGTLEQTHFMDDKTVMDGKYSARLTNENPELAGAQVIWQQLNLGSKLQKLPAGAKIEFSVYARAEKAGTTCHVYLESMSAKKLWAKTVKLQPGQWQRIQIVFEKEDINLNSAYVCLRLVGNGSVCFDKAYFGLAADAPKEQEIVIDPASNRIANGSMELKDPKTGEPQNWSFVSKDPVGKGYLDTTKADNGANSLYLESDTEPKQLVAWTQDGIASRLIDCSPGTEMLLSLRANTGGEPGVKFQFYMEMQKKGKFIGTFKSKPEGIYVGWDTKTLKFKMPDEVPDKVYLVIRLLTHGKVWIDDVRLDKADTAVVPKSNAELVANDFCRTVNLPPRQTYIVPQQPGKLQLEYHLPESVLTVILSEIDGKEVKRYTFENLPVRKTGTAEIVLPELPENAYELRYESGQGDQKLAENDLFRIRKPQTKGIAFTSDHRMTLDGKPFFPIAVVTPRLSVDALRVYSQSGINTVNIGGFASELPLTKYMYEYTSKYNLAVFSWNNLGMRHGASETSLRDQIVKWNKIAAETTNFIGWLDDESAWNVVPLSSLQRNYRLYFKYAPDYIIWQNHAPRLTGSPGSTRDAPESIRRYSRQCDVTGVDIYPVPDSSGHNNLPNRSISCVGDYTDLIMASAWGQKPVWMVLQAFGWSEESGGKLDDKRPRPNKEQLRFMVYNALTHGASGIIWYGGGTKDVYSQFWAEMADVNRELGAVTQIWTIGTDIKMDSGYKDVRICARSDNGQTIVIVVNESRENREVKLKLPGKLYRSPDGLEMETNTFVMPPLSVLVLSSKPVIIKPSQVFKEEITDVPGKYGYHQKTVLLDANWVAHPEFLQSDNKTVFGRQSFSLDKLPAEATLRICGDDFWKVKVNGGIIGDGGSHGKVFEFNVLSALKSGSNLIEIELLNISGPTGVVYEIQAGGQHIASGADTEFSEDGKAKWIKAYAFGKPPIKPWGTPGVFYTETKNLTVN